MKLTLTEIKSAHHLIKNHVHFTEIKTCATIDKFVGAQVFFKCENLQKAGAFKARGAMHSVLRLSADEVKKGICTHSSGNHGQALAWAAAQRGIKATVVMPENAPKLKVAAVKGYGAEVVFCAPNAKAREEKLMQVKEETGAYYLPPYEHELVITGQSTCGLEILEQVPKVDVIIGPVGGGGLMSGVALAANAINPKVKVYGAEPSGADDAYRSLQTGQLCENETANTIADGLRTNLGAMNFPILQKHLAGIITVTDGEIKAALALLWQRAKILAEPSGAVSLAALIKEKEKFANQRVAVIISGGNVDLLPEELFI